MPRLLAGTNGRYNFHPCGLASFFWEFTGITADAFKDFVAMGASDEEVADWVRSNSKVKVPIAIIRWNNEMKCKLISELPDGHQEFYETYVPQFCPQPNKVRFFFDVYDAEEGRL